MFSCTHKLRVINPPGERTGEVMRGRTLTVLMAAVCLLPGIGTSSHAASISVDANLNSFGCGKASPEVSFTSALVDTGIDINVGDTIAITASGQWRISGSDPFTDANGQTGRACHTGPTWPTSSLLGQISDTPLRACDAGSFDKTFFVGTNFSQAAQVSGRLFLAFCDTDFGNNEGAVTATVTVTPAPEPPVAMTIQGVTINRQTGQFTITGSVDVTDPAFDTLVTNPHLRLHMELETQGSAHDPFGIVGQDEVLLKTKKKVLKFQAQ
jgi:hypothetical protein